MSTLYNLGFIRNMYHILNECVFTLEEDSEDFKVYEMESLFIHLANEAYKKRADREIKYIPAYARHIFTRYTYVFESGFECYVRHFACYIRHLFFFYDIHCQLKVSKHFQD